MADQFSRLYDVERVGGDQRTRLAELLRSQGMNQPQGQMVGGWYVPPSWSQNLNSALQLGLGTYMGIKAEDEDRKNLQEDIQRFTAAQQAQGLRKAGQPTTQEQQATTSAYPSTPAQGQVQEGKFRAMKTGGVEGMQSVPGYSMTPQQQQPMVDPYDVEQYKSPRFQQMLQQQRLQQLTAVPEYSTDVKYDQQGRAYVNDKQGNMKYLGTDQAPIRKMSDFNEPFIMNEQGQWVPNQAYQQYSIGKSRASAPSISVNTEKGYGGAMAGKIAELDVAKYNTATKAPQVLENVNRSKQILSQGNVLTGALANPQQAVLAYGQSLGVTGKDTNEILSNTQMLASGRAGATLDAISSSGLGSGQGFSNKDKEFLEQAKLGNIKYTRETLMRQLDLEERVARESSKAWNQRLGQIPESARAPLGLQPIQLPEPIQTTPSGALQGPRLRRGQRQG
jgi:hypothetical protein